MESGECVRLYAIASVGGTSKEKKELSLSLEAGKVILKVTNFAVEDNKRITLAEVEITNKQALMRFRSMLDVAIKTMS
jgi:hypothetical protein